MTAGHLLAAPDRIVQELEAILEEHGISCEFEYSRECDHQRYVIDLTSMICKTAKTQVGMGIEKRRGRKGVDITLAPGCRSFFRRDLDSEELAGKIADILCHYGARKDPHASCEDLE